MQVTTTHPRETRSVGTDRPILGGIADLHDELEPPGPSRRRSILIVAAGLTLIAAGLLTTYRTLEAYFSTTAFETPGTTVTEVPDGVYTLFSSTRTGDRRTQFTARSVEVTDAVTGQPIDVVAGALPTLAAIEGEVYISVGTVEVDTDGSAIAIRVEGQAPARGVLVRSRTSGAAGAQRGFSTVGAGSIVAAVGVGMWITGVRRRREQLDELDTAAHFERIPDPS